MVGAALAFGAPLGFFILRCIVLARLPTPAGLLSELKSEPLVYCYLLVSTLVVFVVLGRSIGTREDRLRERSTTDALTRLFNRRYFQERLEVELRRRARYGSSLSLLLVDLDGLKAINDQWGHSAGDAALRKVAEALRTTARATDVVARYGGDEFMVLAPSTSAGEALEMAERLRKRLDQDLEPVGEGPAPSVSIGIADAGTASEAKALLKAADMALYEAKAAGRDRAVVSRPPPKIGSDPLPAKG